jgi:hypothetical protein
VQIKSETKKLQVVGSCVQLQGTLPTTVFLTFNLCAQAMLNNNGENEYRGKKE